MKTLKFRYLAGFIVSCFFLLTGCKQNTENNSRGVGVYPGNPKEDFSPELVTDNSHYRNIARNRLAFHSSSYDYNLTAQLVTDGIILHDMPDYISVETSNGVMAKNEREWLFDQNPVTDVNFKGKEIWIQLKLSSGDDIPGITKITLNGSLEYIGKNTGGWQFICFGSNDGLNWTELGKSEGTGLPGAERPDPFAALFSKPASKSPGAKRPPNPFASFFAGPYGSDSISPKPSFSFNFGPPKTTRILDQSFQFQEPVKYHYYRVSLSANCAEDWRIGNFDLYNKEIKLKVTPSNSFKSAWMSAGTDQEWIYIDLGAKGTFDKMNLHWINKAAKGKIQVSDDAINWIDIVPLPKNTDTLDNIIFQKAVKGRFVKVLMTEPASGNNYVLSEMEIFGKGGLIARPKADAGISGKRMTLSGGNWRIQRASQVSGTGENIAQSGFQDKNWIVATVPGTVLVSYRNAGALPDPNFGDNQLMISESFFNSDFWYRNEFVCPSDYKGEHTFLNFDGINWKADVFVNGKKTGNIDGAFIRGKFDITDLIKPGQKNVIAVLIKKNDNIGVIKEATAFNHDKNGGILGADNPTYHASIGWDWIPTIRGRNIGIWNDVFLYVSGPVTIEDPLVTTDLALPDTSSADISIEVKLINHDEKQVSGNLSVNYGDIVIDKEVSLGPSESRIIKLNPSSFPVLHLKDPKLWWPKGYGKPYLYNAGLSFKTTAGISDKTEFKSGIRKMSFDETNQILNIYINGRRFIARGGNWGFPESNLEYREREYDIAVAYHADMNFNMIRNWVGQTGDAEFYEACDRHGIMVWQDFWLANPADGPDPENPQMFINNADDMIRRIRNHPSMAIYVGRNEGNPPLVLDTALRTMVKKLHPGLHYISNSAFGVVSGGGPYRALPVRDYFLLYGYNRLHSERGMPNVMTYESLKQMLPEYAIWPQNSLWGLHDYCLESAQSAASFNQMIETGFGKADNAKKFTEFAQFVNYNGYRGMFEGRSLYRQGLLLWMSHPAWPSMVWQTYDYYLEPTAAYFGCKKASEPIHIQWNPVFDNIEVVNYNAGYRSGMTAKAKILNMDGSVQWEKSTGLICKEDSTVTCFKLEFPKSLSDVHFIKLTLSEGEKVISDNFYLRGLEDGNYQKLRDLPLMVLQNKTVAEKTGKEWILSTTVNNNTGIPALMIRLKVVGNTSGDRILPVFYSDNYISLMPGESRVITMRLKDEDTRGEKPAVIISGYNISENKSQ